jgi:hypothetical protein
VTEPYPYADDTATMTPAEARYLTAEVTSYRDADPDDLIAVFVGSIEGAKYDKSGVFVVNVAIPFDVVGDPTEMMRSQGMMLVWEARKLA